MASSPKITVTIPKSLNITAAEEAELKKAFNAEVVRVLEKHGAALGNEIINVKGGRGGSSRSGGSGSGKDRPAAKRTTAKKAAKRK